LEVDREPLPAIALTTDTSLLTAAGNDHGFETIFARQVAGLGRPGDVLVAISTRGNSPNMVRAVEEARQRGLSTLGLLGRDGGRLKEMVHLALVVPSSSTQRIQEVHITVGHILCGALERRVRKSALAPPVGEQKESARTWKACSSTVCKPDAPLCWWWGTSCATSTSGARYTAFLRKH